MLNFIISNLATIIIGTAILLLAVFAVIIIIRDQKKGTSCSSCGCGCEGCSVKQDGKKAAAEIRQ